MSSGGWSEERLARMRDTMAGHIERGSAPGMVTLVARRGEVHAEAFGVQSVDRCAGTRSSDFWTSAYQAIDG